MGHGGDDWLVEPGCDLGEGYSRLSLAGALHDPVAAMLLCHIDRVDYNYINGRPIIAAGNLLTLDTAAPTCAVHTLAAQLVDG